MDMWRAAAEAAATCEKANRGCNKGTDRNRHRCKGVRKGLKSATMKMASVSGFYENVYFYHTQTHTHTKVAFYQFLFRRSLLSMGFAFFFAFNFFFFSHFILHKATTLTDENT